MVTEPRSMYSVVPGSRYPRPEKKVYHQAYKDYTHGIVLSKILRVELEIRHNILNHVQLNKLADDILKNSTGRQHRMMDHRILLQNDDINRCNALLKNLEDVLRKIAELPCENENKLVRIAHELARRVEGIPVLNGAVNLEHQLPANAFSQFTEDPKNMNAVQGINYLIQKLDESLQSLEESHSQLTKSNDALQEMNRIILKVVSVLLSKSIIKKKEEEEVKEDDEDTLRA